jgi:hypothetical protein
VRANITQKPNFFDPTMNGELMRRLRLSLKGTQQNNIVFLAVLVSGCFAQPSRDGLNPNENFNQNQSGSRTDGAGLTPAEREKQEQFNALQEQLRRLEGKLSHVSAQESTASGDFTLPKKFLGEEFLWGSDVQISVSIDESTGKKDEQKTYVLGNRVATLSRVGNRIQVVSREDLTTESDFVSQKIIGSFSVLSETDESLELRASGFGHQSAELAGIASSDFSLRSLQFDAADGTLLLEVTVNQGSGSFTNVLESLTPRINVTAGRSGLEIIPPGPVDGTQPSKIGFNALLDRIGTFPSTAWVAPESPSTGDDLSRVTKTEMNFVSRYNIADGKTIDWWVTSNIPDTLLPEIKAGVEGWNRYFNLFRSDRPVMRFMGKLPESARIGDPRLNIILFDAVSEASSAYESQAVDPLTGYQSHSLIYLPFAWYNISGKRYLQGADDAAVDSAETAARVAQGNAVSDALKAKFQHLRCQRPIGYRDLPFLVNSRAASSMDQAGRALVRSTLLHEVGHALGMDHNFKGTLSGHIAEYNETNWLYSTSTMDYNPFAMEDTLFAEPGNPARDVTQGLVQPYDRQFIDIVYNDASGTIAREEKAYAFCNDADHDNVTNGVDPFCRQYDFFASPEQTLNVPLLRLQSSASYLDKSLGSLITLSGFLRNESSAILADLQSEQKSADSFSKDKKVTLDRAKQALSEFSQAATSGFNHFLRSGSYSVVNALTRDARLLGEWKPIEGIEKNSELSFKSGFQDMANLISGLFGSDGFVSGESYNKYERSTQQTIAAQMSGIFETRRSLSKPQSFESPSQVQSFVDAANTVIQLQAEFVAKLRPLLAEVSLEEAKIFQAAVQSETEIVTAALQDSLTSASVRLIGELGKITVNGSFKDEIVTDRPQIRPEFTHALYVPLASLVTRASATVEDRAAALPWLAVFDTNSKTFAADLKVADPATGTQVLASEFRAKVLAAALATLEGEKAPIYQKILQGQYLTGDERKLHEFLTYALGVLRTPAP